MNAEFETSKTFPWFIYNDKTFGFDADRLIEDFLDTKLVRIYNAAPEYYLSAVRDVVQQVRDTSYAYESVDKLHKRFQLIINGLILERYLQRAAGHLLIRKSDPKWVLNGTYESGTDFVTPEGIKVEAKVYYSELSMIEKVNAANRGNRYIFHDADYVCCYLITSQKYQWLRRVNGVYSTYEDSTVKQWSEANLPSQLPLCRCEEKFTPVGEIEWELHPFYFNNY